MKQMKFNTVAARTVATCFSLGLFMAAQSAAACTLQNWSGVSGLTDADNAGGPTDGISRYSGVCAMQTAADTEGWVEDNSPGGIDRIRARFYVLANNSADAVIYRGFDGDGSGNELFNLQIAADGAVSISSGSISIPIPAPGAAVDPGWNSVEIDWNSGGEFGLIINGQSVTTSGSSAAGSLVSVLLGNLNGATGTLNFDGYESRRATEIGRLCRADPDGDGSRTLADLDVLFSEIQSFGTIPAPGTPDGNENGIVQLPDLDVVFNFIQSLQGDCSAFPG